MTTTKGTVTEFVASFNTLEAADRFKDFMNRYHSGRGVGDLFQEPVIGDWRVRLELAPDEEGENNYLFHVGLALGFERGFQQGVSYGFAAGKKESAAAGNSATV